ncbi:DUF4180 domain-containing protein [Streptomonospora litoralis]|uniref:DUF4180 domain-containing protein n=1 Tax=Streptomonospora litoralis TaxID=2498135 RepID=UPI001F615780|nr:DUF4180 domain-containing protein [Streptomonospora litoralis]
MDTVQELSGTPVLVCAPEGAPLDGERAALDLIGDMWGRGAAWAALPAERLGAGFFDLANGVAGGVVQRLANYRLGLAVVGAVPVEAGAGSAAAAFVREADRGAQLWFVADLVELGRRLARG